MRAFLANNWLKLLVGLSILLLAILILVQATSYGRALLAKHGLVKAQAQASAQHSQRQQATTARYQHYQLDSAVQATKAQQQLREIHLSQQRDEALDKARPARPALPAWNDLPRE